MTSSKNKKWLVIVNPIAGRGRMSEKLNTITLFFNTHQIDYTLRTTSEKGHAIKLTQEGIQQGFRNIIGIGGDGTNNEIINGIFFQNEVPSHEITYTLLPVGTGNDWVKEHKIPRDLKAWQRMFLAAKTSTQDIGLIQYFRLGQPKRRYFANVAGMSYDAYVLDEINKLNNPMRGRLAYLFYGLYYVFKYKIPKARVRFNQRVLEDNFYLINAGICKFSGGGMQLVPHAVPNDGKLAITLAGKISKLGVILNSRRFYNGKIIQHPKVQTFQTSVIKIEGIDSPILIEADGEVLGETPVEISILKNALQIIVP